VRAGLLLRAGRTAEAADEYAVAASLCGGDAERAFLLARRDALSRRD
jgi:RNA polymerase sigma-70 factor (ECF subfamily)